MSARAKLSVSVDQVQRHIEFLKRVHDDALNRESGLYRDRSILGEAVTRYEDFWLPLVQARGDEGALVPPIDIAWVWHLHRLAPLKYAAYCRERFGAVLEPGASAFRLQTERDQTSADAEDCARTREAWASAYPAEPFFWAQGSPAVDRRETSLAEPMIATALRQSTFLWQVSQPGFSDERFLAAAIERYDMFLRLMGTHGYRQHFYVPSYDVDLCWHTHMLAEPAAYLEETAERAGEPVNHDDSVNQRHKGSKLNTSWADTKKLWRKSYGGIKGTAALDAPGTCYRGEPPSWWFSDRCGAQRVQVHERVLAAEHCQELAAQLAGLAGEAVNTEADLEMSLPVPNALYDAIMSVMRVGGAAPAALAPETNTVLVPAKISRKALPLHQDRYLHGGKHGALAEGYSAVLYLSDGGAMSFVDAASKHRVRDIRVEPGRLVVWDNDSLLHAVCPADATAPRFMLGPMSVNSMGALVAVGGGGCGGGGGGGGCGGGGCGATGGGCGGGGNGGNSTKQGCSCVLQ